MFDAIRSYFVSFFKENKAKDYLVSLFKGNKSTVEPILEEGKKVWFAICNVRALYHKVLHVRQDGKNTKDLIKTRVNNALDLLASLEGNINKIREKNPTIESSAMMKLLLSIAKDKKLRESLKELNDLAEKCDYTPGSTSCEELYSLVGKVAGGFKLRELENKIKILTLLKITKNFTNVCEAYNDDWFFCVMMSDEDFGNCIDEAVGEEDEPIRKSLKKGINKYRRLARLGEDIASKYFEEEASFLAYCKETEDDNKILNVNLIDYDKSKPIRISDILRQEEDVDKLNIYCKSRREIRAFRGENNERHYRFEKGAHYEMTSTWSVEDESGNTSTCTMVMDVSNKGITKIVEFNGENFESPSKEFWELIGQNKELHIQGSSLRESVEKFLRVQRNREDIIRKGEDGKRDSSLPDVVAGSSSTPSTNNNASESTEEAATHTGGNPLLDDDVFFDCTEGFEGVVVEDDSSASCGSFPVPTTPPTTSRNTYRSPGS